MVSSVAMTPAQALKEAAQAGRYNQFDLSTHARKRMFERNAMRVDICRALESATSATLEEGDKWHLAGGVDTDGVPLEIVIVFTMRGLIVTVF